MNYSPLRYPGGKLCLYPLISSLLENLNVTDTYIEPFAGGAGIALSLLLNRKVSSIVINDYDKAIYSFWRAILEKHDSLIDRILSTPVTIDEWDRQRKIYLSSKRYSIDFAFATFFLNRTNRSGILKGGPIGGIKQVGEWSLDARYYTNTLIERIQLIASRKNDIKLYNKDIRKFIDYVLPKCPKNSFIYFDPPYVNNGKRLYKNFLTAKDHHEISQSISQNVYIPWVVSYDDTPLIRSLYSQFYITNFEIRYSANVKKKANEILIMHPEIFQIYSHVNDPNLTAI